MPAQLTPLPVIHTSLPELCLPMFLLWVALWDGSSAWTWKLKQLVINRNKLMKAVFGIKYIKLQRSCYKFHHERTVMKSTNFTFGFTKWIWNIFLVSDLKLDLPRATVRPSVVRLSYTQASKLDFYTDSSFDSDLLCVRKKEKLHRSTKTDKHIW